MTKPILKLGFTDYFTTMDEFFIDTLSKSFEIIRDDTNPDYLIFADETFGQNNLNYKNCIKIFFTGENRRPWNYQCHHAISFDHLDGPNFYRLPLYVLDDWVNVKKMNLPSIQEIPQIKDSSLANRDFCSFVVANAGCKQRNDIFYELTSYVKVNSGGPLFNNIGHVLPRDGTNAQKTKYDFLRKHKFNICYENSSWPGYVTEKLFHALYCQTIPIYWGSPTVALDFNENAFISRHNFDSDDDMIDFIFDLHQNDDKYMRMLEQPPVAKSNTRFDLNKFTHWFLNNVYKGVR